MFPPRLLLWAGVLLALGGLWAARNAPVSVGSVLLFDGLSGFWVVALIGGAALAATSATRWRTLLPLLPLAVALLSPLAAVLVAGFAVAALLAAPPGSKLRWAWLLPVVCLLLGYGTLAARGAWLLSDPAAGAALNSFSFFFVLLAALIPIMPLLPRPANAVLHGPLRMVWLYPLARLYTLGPWNPGWNAATILLAGAAACWALPFPGRRAGSGYAALALAGIGLGSGAGVAAGCYGVLACLLTEAAWSDNEPNNALFLLQSLLLRPVAPVPLHWLLSAALPFTTPFVAVWMMIGAATAAGVPLLAALVWLAVLVGAVRLALRPGPLPPRPLVAWASVVLGVGAPLVALLLIEPSITQLQGGLTPYGDITIWPWMALNVRNSGGAQVAALPSVAVAALMLVLCALVWLLARLRPATPPDADTPAEPTTPIRLLDDLRREVPWLALFPRAKRERK